MNYKPEYSDHTYTMACKIVEQSLKQPIMLPNQATEVKKVHGKPIQPWSVTIDSKGESTSIYIRHALDLDHAKKRMKDIIHSGVNRKPDGSVEPVRVSFPSVVKVTIQSQAANVTYMCKRKRKGWTETVSEFKL